MPAVRLIVRGLVQGVGFRWFARQAARRADLAGWVRNLPDGSVEIGASGEQEALDRFIATVSRGPDGARIDRVETLPLAEDPPLKRPFSILR